MVDQLNFHQAEATAEMAGGFEILPGRQCVSVWMVVGDYNRCGVVFESLGQYQTGMDLGGVDAPFKYGGTMQNLTPIV